MTGILVAHHSNDGGAQYSVSAGGVGPAQSVDAFLHGNHADFVITGDTILFNGISVSHEYGVCHLRAPAVVRTWVASIP